MGVIALAKLHHTFLIEPMREHTRRMALRARAAFMSYIDFDVIFLRARRKFTVRERMRERRKKRAFNRRELSEFV